MSGGEAKNGGATERAKRVRRTGETIACDRWYLHRSSAPSRSTGPPRGTPRDTDTQRQGSHAQVHRQK